MCGFVAVVSCDHRQISEEILIQMADKLRHRGPDDSGFYLAPTSQVGLGSRRLSIIDLITGHQPIHNEDQTIWLVFNGEIYNFLELRESLVAKGHQFYTRTDSEVIVHAYEEYGVECLQQFNGMFAFAIWDERKTRLFVARDRLGIKPVYYYQGRQRIIVASEIKAILEEPTVSRDIDPISLYQYLSLRFVLPPRTLFAGISKLPAGHYMIVEDARISVKGYWDLVFEPKSNLSEEAIADQIRYLLRDAVRLRLVSDVPLGAFLSGGIDSSTIVSIMSRQMDEPVKTFSVRFASAAPQYDETPYARRVSRLFNTDHHEIVVEPVSLDDLRKLTWYLDEPIADPAMLPMYLVSKLARTHVTVCLSGDGGDELFAGYAQDRLAWLVDRYVALPELFKTFASVIGHIPGIPLDLLTVINNQHPPGSIEQLTSMGCIHASDIAKILLHPQLRDHVEREKGDIQAAVSDLLSPKRMASALQNTLYWDTRTILPELFLMKVDKMSMANSLEVRVPFLDYRLVEFMASLPESVKLKWGRPKYLLKQALCGLLPADILLRKKQGFIVPLDRWLASPLYEADWLLGDLSERLGDYLDVASVEAILKANQQGRGKYGRIIFALMLLVYWYDHFIV